MSVASSMVIIETTFVITESAVHLRALHVGEFHVKIEFQTPAHCM